MKNLIILALAILSLQTSAQNTVGYHTSYKVLADFKDESNCAVTLTWYQGIYTVTYANYLLLGSGFHDAFSTRDKKQLKYLISQALAAYQDREERVYKIQITAHSAVYVKNINGEVFIMKPKEQSSFRVYEETAIKLLEALK